MKTLLYLCVLLVLTTRLDGKDHCSLVVSIVDSKGVEVEALVKVEERDGRIVETENQPGGVRVCNLGILPVSVTVGHPSCNQIVVRNLDLRWEETRVLKIVYDRNPGCLYTSVARTWCQILFRFVDSQRNPVGGVRLRLETPYQAVLDGDQFGRVLVRPSFGKTARGMAEARGYRAVQVSATCATESRDFEQYVVLEKADNAKQ